MIYMCSSPSLPPIVVRCHIFFWKISFRALFTSRVMSLFRVLYFYPQLITNANMLNDKAY